MMSSGIGNGERHTLRVWVSSGLYFDVLLVCESALEQRDS